MCIIWVLSTAPMGAVAREKFFGRYVLINSLWDHNSGLWTCLLEGSVDISCETSGNEQLTSYVSLVLECNISSFLEGVSTFQTVSVTWV